MSRLLESVLASPIPEPYHWPKTKNAYQTRSLAIVTWRSIEDNLSKAGWSWGWVSAVSLVCEEEGGDRSRRV